MKVELPANTIGFESSEDCAVFPLDEKHFLIQSVDFFTPIVDDPFTFGQIAATNSLSDIYAMGGEPLYALNIAEFPSDDLPLEILSQILDGGLDIAKKVGIPILGGHTLKDSVPKFGLVVTGRVEKNNLTLNSTAKAGDVLILTKPLGLGILSTAIKKEKAPSYLVDEAISIMTHLNKGATESMNSIGVHACTDITGYGLLGHLLEICKASKVTAEIDYNLLPLLPETLELANDGIVPGGTKRNLSHAESFTQFHEDRTDIEKLITSDSQTSGGLLISISSEKTESFLQLFNEQSSIKAQKIGKITEQREKVIFVL